MRHIFQYVLLLQAKGDPSASSKRQSSGSTSTSFTKKETDSKDHGKKETSDSKTNSTTRKSSSSTQPSTKADKGNSDNQGKVDRSVPQSKSPHCILEQVEL